MAPNKTADLILQQWVASLKTRDRSRKAVPDNFDELFSDLKKAGVPFDDAHELLTTAIKAHLPSKSTVRYVWTNNKALHSVHAGEKEFTDDWNDCIKSAATDAFFSNYPLKINDDDDGEPKVYGSMSVKEYRLQRKYADSFPTLNTDDLERQLRERKSLAGDLDDVLGGKDDK